ncbi:hypothetical protein RND81_01G082900 [Saponaria officinalis]|uniref:Ubiquitin-like protease family profile domain-containing protein n=1 Tax=Saponaria officinalis TaxID=3572 RepID=A0AAW1N968_SAPOF
MEKEVPTNTNNQEAPKKQGRRGTLAGVKAQKLSGTKNIQFDDKGRPFGIWRNKLATDMGAIARNIRIINQDWSKVPEGQKETIWLDVKYWSELAKKGEFVPRRLEDVLVKATCKYDHPGRTRGVGSHVGLQQYFGKPTSRAPRGNLYTLDELNSFREEVKRETMDEMKVIMNQQLSEILKDCGVQLPREFEVNMRDSPLLSRRRDQSSCHSADLNDPLKSYRYNVPTACRLAVLEFENLITVDEGMVWPWVEGKKVHNTPLSPQNVQVSIDKIIESTAPLPVPWDVFQRVGEVLGSFAQWPKQLVLLRLDEALGTDKEQRLNDDSPQIVCKCPQQPHSYDCGYYVMKWMYDITVDYSRKKDNLEKCVTG